MKRVSFLISYLVIMGFSLPGKKKIKLWMVGDSTMSVKEKKAWPETGWGMPFVNFWDSTVTVDNRAKNGRSTRSFMTEGLWKSVTDELAEGDYVFIQFGHNDEVPTKKTATTPNEFKTNLIKYIRDTRNKKAIPVLLTSVARRKFDANGKLESTHEEYSAITRSVAKETKVLFIDMDKKSQEVLQRLGVEGSTYLFNQLKPGENPNYPDGVKDDTHFSELGARKMAELVLAEIRNLKIDLVERIIVFPVKKPWEK
ncbi:MAG: rhamnogalacturonan acetylesterase [Bacteroidota bacterium]